MRFNLSMSTSLSLSLFFADHRCMFIFVIFPTIMDVSYSCYIILLNFILSYCLTSTWTTHLAY